MAPQLIRAGARLPREVHMSDGPCPLMDAAEPDKVCEETVTEGSPDR